MEVGQNEENFEEISETVKLEDCETNQESNVENMNTNGKSGDSAVVSDSELSTEHDILIITEENCDNLMAIGGNENEIIQEKPVATVPGTATVPPSIPVQPPVDLISPLAFFSMNHAKRTTLKPNCEVKKDVTNGVQLALNKNKKRKNKKHRMKLKKAQELSKVGSINSVDSVMHNKTNIVEKQISGISIVEITNPNINPVNQSNRANEIPVNTNFHGTNHVLNSQGHISSNFNWVPPRIGLLNNCESDLYKNMDTSKLFSIAERSNPLISVIVEEDYPDVRPLTDTHLNVLRKFIKFEIDQIESEAMVPRFEHSYIKNGVILVKCADEDSREWLKIVIPKLFSEEGVKLKVISVNELNRLYEATICVLYDNNAIVVLNRIQKQNPELNMDSWQFYSQKLLKGETPGIILTLGIPESSVNILKTKGFKLYHGIEQINVNVKNVPSA